MTGIRFPRRNARNPTSGARNRTGILEAEAHSSHGSTAPLLTQDEDVVEIVDAHTTGSSCAKDVDEQVKHTEAGLRANQLRVESNLRRHRRRGATVSARAKSSLWTTLAAVGLDDGNKYRCALCSKKISLSQKSSSNIVSHYRFQHKSVAREVLTAESLTAKTAVMERALERSRRTQPILDFLVATDRTPSKTVNKTSKDGWQTEYVRLLPSVYEAVSRRTAAETGNVKVGSFTYDGWSAKLGASIAGMTFNFVDADWNLRTFPLCFFDTEDLGKSANEHEAVIAAAVHDNDKLGPDVLVFSGTSDNEPSVALGVDKYLNFSGAVRCCCHSLALAVNDAVRDCLFVTEVLQRINAISTYVNMHKKVSAKLVQLQCAVFSRDRIVMLDKEFMTRWHSKLNVLEKYIILRPYLSQALPSGAPQLLDISSEDAVAECISILREVRRVSRALEADRRVSGSRVPRLLRELYDTLQVMASRRDERHLLFAQINKPRESCAGDDAAVIKARACTTRDEDARKLAGALRDTIHERMKHLYTPVCQEDALLVLSDADEEEKKSMRKEKQSVLLHAAALFDANECAMDWYPRHRNVDEYVGVLVQVIVGELRDILADEYDQDEKYDSYFMSIRKPMLAELEQFGRREPKYALDWWKNIENSTVVNLRKRRLSLAPIFLDAARAFLSIQASSASAERLFGDAGYQEGARRQATGSSVTEMLLMVRSYVATYLSRTPLVQARFISSHGQAVKNLAADLAGEIDAENE
eukprot:IDg3336t1